MTRQHSGGRTSPAQQRINQAQSEASLFHLLQRNFSGGAHQIVLTYEAGGYVPVGVYALQDVQDWIRAARHQLGTPLKYVRTVEQRQGDDKPITVHRVLVSCSRVEAERIAEKWAHGLTRVEFVPPGYLPALAKRFSGNSTAGSGRHSWIPSKGLVRS